MTLRAELDAAYRKIAHLEKELERYRSIAINGAQSKESTKVVTRSAAKCDATSSDRRQSADGLSTCVPATRSRSKAMARRMELKPASGRGSGSEGSSSPNEKMASGMSVDGSAITISGNGGANRDTIRPTPRDSAMAPPAPIMANTFVPLKHNLPTAASAFAAGSATVGGAPSPAQCLVAAKMTSVNILSASSNITTATTVNNNSNPPSSPTMSTNNIALKKSASKRHSTSSPSMLQSSIAKLSSSSRKERSGGLVAKCTEPRPGQTRYWTEEEHERFLEAVAQYGEKAYVAISNYVETRTPKQVRTHAQKFQMKVARLAKERSENGEMMELPAGMLPSSIGIEPSKVLYTAPLNATPLQVEAAARAASENEARRRAKREAEQQASAATSQGQGNNNMQLLLHVQPQLHNTINIHNSSSESETNSSGGSSNNNNNNMEQPMLQETISSVSDVTNEELTDPYLNYIGGSDSALRQAEGLSEFEECFAARLPKSWEIGKIQEDTLINMDVVDAKAKNSSIIPGGILMGGSGRNDDDLEDLEECGELSMASLINFGI